MLLRGGLSRVVYLQTIEKQPDNYAVLIKFAEHAASFDAFAHALFVEICERLRERFSDVPRVRRALAEFMLVVKTSKCSRACVWSR